MVALHSSDPTTVYLSVWARVPGFEVADLEEALYEKRSLVRFYGMRRTLWVIERSLVPSVHNSSTRVIGVLERARTIRLLEEGGVTDDGGAWLDEVIPRILAVIREHGEILARDLTKKVSGLDQKITFYNRAGKQAGSTGLSSRTLVQLAVESRVVRAHPAGTWISGQYRWAEMEDWLGGPIEELTIEEASSILVGRWLHTFGPGTEADLRWWTGWPARQVRAALETVGAVAVGLDDGTGYLLEDDLDPVEAPEPWVALLPSLDPTTMGWKERRWYLGPHADRLFDRNGNAGPTVWVDGQIVGAWAQRNDGEIVYDLLEDVGREAVGSIEARARDLQEWMGDITITPRFRSPHDKDLAG
jgi:hypothetical protein